MSCFTLGHSLAALRDDPGRKRKQGAGRRRANSRSLVVDGHPHRRSQRQGFCWDRSIDGDIHCRFCYPVGRPARPWAGVVVGGMCGDPGRLRGGKGGRRGGEQVNQRVGEGGGVRCYQTAGIKFAGRDQKRGRLCRSWSRCPPTTCPSSFGSMGQV